MLGLRLSAWGLILAWLVRLAGGALAILASIHTPQQDASVLTFYLLQAGTAVFFLCRTFFFLFAGVLWTRHVTLDTPTMEGLANTTAAPLIVVLQLVWGVYQLVFYLLETYFGYQMDTIQSDINVMVLQYV